VVEYSPHYPNVKGLSPAAPAAPAALAGNEIEVFKNNRVGTG
jgi:hypothetical protein